MVDVTFLIRSMRILVDSDLHGRSPYVYQTYGMERCDKGEKAE